MSISFENVAAKYLVAKKLASGTCKEYRGTAAKWTAWGKGVNVDQIGRTHLRDFLDWLHEKATADGGSNAGRMANNARENLRAILSWAWDQDFLEKLPRFPKLKLRAMGYATRSRKSPLESENSPRFYDPNACQLGFS